MLSTRTFQAIPSQKHGLVIQCRLYRPSGLIILETLESIRLVLLAQYVLAERKVWRVLLAY